MRDPALDPRRSILGRSLLAAISFLVFGIGAVLLAVWPSPTSLAGAALVIAAVFVALYSVLASTDAVVRSSGWLTRIFIDR